MNYRNPSRASAIRHSILNWRFTLWLGTSFVLLALVLKVTSELLENEIQHVDSRVLVWFVSLGRPWWTAAFVDVTALGSTTPVVIISLVALSLLILCKDRIGALQLALTSAGAGLLTVLTKNFIERARPDEVSHLLEVNGFSYPSGHSLASASLYLAVALVTSRHLPTAVARTVLFGFAIAIVSLVAASRLYLGVHYPSDVFSGVSLGASWALLLAAAFSKLGNERSHA